MAQIVEYNGKRIEFPDGMPPAEIEAAIKQNALSLPAAVTAGKAVNTGLSDIPRQLGLTARYALEGPANAAQIFTEPVAGLMRAAGVNTKPLGQIATGFADTIGLPSPQGANERVIGDATRLVAGGGLMGSAASAGTVLPGLTGKVMAGLAANPAQQLSSAAGAGLLGGASREAGGSDLVQAGASLVGGVAGGMAPGIAQGVMNAGKRTVAPAMTPQQIDVRLEAVLGRTGADYSQIPEQARRALRKEVASAMQAGRELDPAAVRRLADFAVVGATPTRGMVSQNPLQITREMNLAKTAAASSDGSLSGLPLVQNQNNTTLINRLNDVGGASETIPMAAGNVIRDRVNSTRAGLQSAEQAAWDAAKGMPGYKAPIFPDGLNAMNRALGEDAMMGYMPKQITDYMAAFQTGQQPFTPQAYRNLQSMLSGEMAKGGNEAAAAGIARRALESTPMRPLTETGRDIGSAPVTGQMAQMLRESDAQAGSAIDAINTARGATRAKYAYEESSPLVRSVLGGSRSADPEKLAQSFVINGSLRDAQSVAREVGPEGIATIRDAIATHIKKQSVGGAADEVGKVSQSALNAALRKIGEDKLRLFFSPEEVASLQATGRVASYMQVQPVGSAVNNSNSATTLMGRGLDVLNGFAGKVPFGQSAIIDPLRNINISIGQRQAQNIAPGLLAEIEKPRLGPSLLLPGLAVGGLLAAP